MERSKIRPVVIAPTYNNAHTLDDIIRRTQTLGLPLIVVNDGSTDQTAELLTRWAGGGLEIFIQTHATNQGKAAALRTGFTMAAERGFSHAVTIDTDGQLDPEQIPLLLEESRRNPDALVVGTRDDRAGDYPRRSRLGRRVSNLLVRLESGMRISDSQCGFRVYPLDLVRSIGCRAGHYGFETEIITRAAWAGWSVAEVPVNCRYFPASLRVSHFRPVKDSACAIVMHAFLICRTLLPLRPMPDTHIRRGQGNKSSWRRIAAWLSPLRAWRDLRESHTGRTELAAGLAIGVFIANLPIYGLQSIASLYTARRLHLHPLSVLLGSHISTPPIGPVMIAGAIAIGHVVLYRKWPALVEFQPQGYAWSQIIWLRLLEWGLGGILLGLVMAGATFLLARILMQIFGDRPMASRE